MREREIVALEKIANGLENLVGATQVDKSALQIKRMRQEVFDAPNIK
jgi:hypothetical protein